MTEISRLLCEAVSAGVVVHDKDGVITYANRAACSILHQPASQLVGNCFVIPGCQVIREDGSPFSHQDYPALITVRTGQPLHNVVMGLYFSQGTERWIRLDSEPIRDPETGAVREVLVTFQDISREKHAEEELRGQTEFGSAILDTVENLVVVLDPQGRIQLFNRACEQVTGYRFEDVKGRPFWEFLLCCPRSAPPSRTCLRN
jgi:PAS domain S-box-containing protein